ncbi:hypothetical protein DCAR_0831421 [Daucus carota subsp. sativus]|uniref:Protein CHUP1, chloroplastic n=1 Tax=Daucus carota subsp. sativus TaxID=79200 RepID=A0AAF0XPK3_DAUCS|nr:hypothetical protein DCAR_0831421 [Daucus carota subsp. sativus]
MVAGKVKAAMGMQSAHRAAKQESSPSSSPSPSSGKAPQKGTSFSRSLSNYFPRASAQVLPKPPDVTELLHIIEELRERESRLKTELLEYKLLKESVAILPFLEEEIARRDADIGEYIKNIESLESENGRLRREMEMLQSKYFEEETENERYKKNIEQELTKAKMEKTITSRRLRVQEAVDVDEHCKANVVKNSRPNVSLLEHYNANRIEIEAQKMKEKATQNSEEISGLISATTRSPVPRVPKPPPRPSILVSVLPFSDFSGSTLSMEMSVVPVPPPPPPRPVFKVPSKSAPPPPPPLPLKGSKTGVQKVRRVPEVVEFYHSLMRRDSRRESGNGAATMANARDMIGEIENRSTHLLAIKTDVETQGDFIRFLIREVENAALADIQDVVLFVKWLDDELSYLVDERAVLKHFQWPEQKSDALREAAFGFSDLKKLESEVSSFQDDPQQLFAPALKKMQALFEKLEHGIHNLSRTRESAAARYKGFRIPVDWMLDTGYVTQIKLASVKLAMKYMRRVSAELENVDGGPEEEELIVQGVKFAFRVHQFAGGFDAETMKAFQELRNKARSCREPKSAKNYL